MGNRGWLLDDLCLGPLAIAWWLKGPRRHSVEDVAMHFLQSAEALLGWFGDLGGFRALTLICVEGLLAGLFVADVALFSQLESLFGGVACEVGLPVVV